MHVNACEPLLKLQAVSGRFPGEIDGEYRGEESLRAFSLEDVDFIDQIFSAKTPTPIDLAGVRRRVMAMCQDRSHHGSAQLFGQTSMRVPAVRARPMVRSQSFPPIREASA